MTCEGIAGSGFVKCQADGKKRIDRLFLNLYIL